MSVGIVYTSILIRSRDEPCVPNGKYIIALTILVFKVCHQTFDLWTQEPTVP